MSKDFKALRQAIEQAEAVWRSMRDLWTVLPDEEDEHAEAVKPVGLPHNRRGN